VEEAAQEETFVRGWLSARLMKRTTEDDVIESSRKNAERTLKEQEWMVKVR